VSFLPVPPPPPPREPPAGRALLSALQSSLRLGRWAFGALALIYLLSGVTLVGPGHAGLVYRFGRLLPEVRDPGLLLALPRPFDRVVTLNVAEQRELVLDAWRETAAEQLGPIQPAPRLGPDGQPLPPPRPSLDPEKQGYTLCGDRNLVRGEFSLRYQIADPVAYLRGGRDPEACLAALFYRGLAGVLARESIDPLLGEGRERIRRLAFESADQAAASLDLGVRLLAVEFRQILPPAAVADAFREVAAAQVEAGTLVEQARSHRATLLPAARAEADALRSRAESEASALHARARGEAVAFAAVHGEYSKSPDGFAARRLAETLAPLMPRWRGLLVSPAGHPAPRLLLPAPGKPETAPATPKP
jgi:membrane protease subunit HflK